MIIAQDNIVEERITFMNNGLTLSGILSYPGENDPSRLILLCSPHPHFAGDMENNIIKALAQDLANDSVTVRFDYRGVGRSEISLPDGHSVFDYWQEIEENKEYADAVSDVTAAAAALKDNLYIENLPMIVSGYSFGLVTGMRFGMTCSDVKAIIGISPPWTRVSFEFAADCDKPALLLSARKDFLYSQEEIDKVNKVAGNNVTVQTLDSGDHFFRGEEDVICQNVRLFIDSL